MFQRQTAIFRVETFEPKLGKQIKKMDGRQLGWTEIWIEYKSNV